MKIKIKVLPLVRKYLEKKTKLPLNLSRGNFFAMMLFAQMKYRHTRPAEDYAERDYSDEIVMLIDNATYFNVALLTPNRDGIYGFNQNIYEMFVDEMEKFMDTQTQIKKYVDRLDAFCEKFDLLEEDINKQSLLRKYRRYRSELKEDANNQ